jgi:hypothetical protein
LNERSGDLSESQARSLVSAAVDWLGGAHSIVGAPRHPFSRHASDTLDVEEYSVTVHYGEMSSPAIAVVSGWVFEITTGGFVLLDAPRARPGAS